MGTTLLDYYVLRSAGTPGAPASGLLVEEFVLADDLAAVRLRSAGWTTADGDWWSSAAFAQAVRVDPSVRAGVTAVDRGTAEDTYRELCGAALPDEDALRGRFSDDVALASGETPLRLGTGTAAVHRVLFAGEPDGAGLDGLRAHLQLRDVPDGTRPGVVGTGALRVNASNLRWDLRRIGGGAAWCLDLTAEPADHDALRWLIRQLTMVARRHGLIPATIDRLS